jgi:hypothetical protein
MFFSRRGRATTVKMNRQTETNIEKEIAWVKSKIRPINQPFRGK